MLDHIELKTADLAGAVAFYATVLEPLGYALKVDGPAKGFGDATRLDFFLIQGTPAADVHHAFESPDRATVDRIYALAETQGLTLDRAPALAPHVHPDYYAGYLRDPDGRLVEFVCHKAA